MLLATLVTTKGKGVTRAGRNFQCRFILQLILKYNNIIKVNLNLRNSLSKINNQEDVINLDEYKTIGTHCMYVYYIVCEY